MTTIAAAIVAGCFSLGAVLLSFALAKIRRDLAECVRDRRELRRTLQQFVNALVGVLPPRQRDALLETASSALADLAEQEA